MQHEWSTPKNEGLNTSVASYSTKSKHYCGTLSLDTRVCITGSAHVLGYYHLRTRIFHVFDISINYTLESHWRQRDNGKQKRSNRAMSINGKSARSRLKYEKLVRIQQAAPTSFKEGLGYESGITLAAAVKLAKNLPSQTTENNTEGTPKEQWRCKYYHADYCHVLGHKTSRSLVCGMNKKNAKEREAVAEILFKDFVLSELKNPVQS